MHSVSLRANGASSCRGSWGDGVQQVSQVMGQERRKEVFGHQLHPSLAEGSSQGPSGPATSGLLCTGLKQKLAPAARESPQAGLQVHSVRGHGMAGYWDDECLQGCEQSNNFIHYDEYPRPLQPVLFCTSPGGAISIRHKITNLHPITQPG